MAYFTVTFWVPTCQWKKKLIFRKSSENIIDERLVCNLQKKRYWILNKCCLVVLFSASVLSTHLKINIYLFWITFFKSNSDFNNLVWYVRIPYNMEKKEYKDMWFTNSILLGFIFSLLASYLSTLYHSFFICKTAIIRYLLLRTTAGIII